ncbi:hypothetical protein [Pedobacter insulae]|uniref:Uncharacterized protein n=1 Tax=Pedobacter insulae TaxID=414048 RepID=A0A1I3ANA8_9SPHI|nr:hypothetical protein [Pedobacter insulae]SFH51493.1 hypothetical protein SAMN04489864_11710 [Pedobacter insulae]
MPTIEIASINSQGLGLNQDDFALAIIEENKLISHRGLFYNLLLEQDGTIVHVGNPDFKDDKEIGFFADEIIDWSVDPNDQISIPIHDTDDIIDDRGSNQQFIFKILSQYKVEINQILTIAVDNSPNNKVCFLTDYQFGPENANIEIIYTINDFWALHDSGGLTFTQCMKYMANSCAAHNSGLAKVAGNLLHIANLPNSYIFIVYLIVSNDSIK